MSDVQNVSDTARWVAWYRAEESARKDRLFDDPLAARVAGDHGRAIATQASLHTRWVIVTRTVLMDRMVQASIAEGVDCVLNLAAGYDTRPYRLDLPKDLLWIEADLPALVDDKERLLAGETPRCRVQRERVDLADAQARQRLFDEVAKAARKVLVITEGLIVYLEPEVVSDLAKALAHPPFQFWILDFSSTEILKMMTGTHSDTLKNAPMRFAADEGVQYFVDRGWKHREVQSLFREAARVRRLPWMMRPFAWLPQPDMIHAKGGRWTAVARLERA